MRFLGRLKWRQLRKVLRPAGNEGLHYSVRRIAEQVSIGLLLNRKLSPFYNSFILVLTCLRIPITFEFIFFKHIDM